MTTTTTEYTNLDQAFDYFNAELFGGQLPLVLLTFQRHGQAYGYYAPKRFKARHGDETTDEIALNPEMFNTPDLEILQTLVHEMAHLWQQHFGKPSRSGYHNAQWAKKMMEIGLMPSDTGKPGGKTTGQHMGDYPITGGRFEEAARQLLESGFAVHWMDNWKKNGQPSADDGDGEEEGEAGQPAEPKPKNKIKYTCPTCQANVWGKPALKLICGECMETMESKE